MGLWTGVGQEQRVSHLGRRQVGGAGRKGEVFLESRSSSLAGQVYSKQAGAGPKISW